MRVKGLIVSCASAWTNHESVGGYDPMCANFVLSANVLHSGMEVRGVLLEGQLIYSFHTVRMYVTG